MTIRFLLASVIGVLFLLITEYARATYPVDTTKFASKNSYMSSSTNEARQQATDKVDIINDYCRPLQVSAVLRHGTRNPSTGDINNINSVLNSFQATKESAAAVQQLAGVVAQFPLSSQGLLVEAGYLEHQGLGYRMAGRYRDLFNGIGLDQLSFSATSVNRTVESCKGFQNGFFQLHNSSLVAPIVIRDDILRFYDTCDAYQALEANSSTFIQYTTFQNMYFSGIIKNYTNDLQLPTVNITNDEMNSVYQVAAIEYAALNTTYWAQYINPQDLLTLEYASDLDAYYKLGYAYPINYDMSCPLVSTLFHDMDKVFNGSSYLKGLFYFAHAETITPLFDVLGLYKDAEPLTASNYAQQSNRQFRTGYITPFASNVAFVQYSCDVQAIQNNRSAGNIPDGIFPASPVKNMTLMLVKEAPTTFPAPACEKAILCSYQEIRKYYSQPIDQCNYNATCDNFQSPPNSAFAMINGEGNVVKFILYSLSQIVIYSMLKF